MLDGPHRLVLRAAGKGSAPDSPALRALADAGLVDSDGRGGYRVTAHGRAALAASEPSRADVRWTWLLALALVALALL